MGGGLFRTLLIIALVYYGVRFLRRVLFPFLFKAFIKKAAQKGQQQYSEQQRAQKVRPEGEVHIEYVNKNNKKSAGDVGGEYVDFEEIKPE